MTDHNRQLWNQIDMLYEGNDQFILEYELKMQHPTQLLASAVRNLRNSTDEIIIRANLETILRMVRQMDHVIDTLTQQLEQKQTNAVK